MFATVLIHVTAVFAKLGMFFIIPRLHTVEQVRRFLERYRPYERVVDIILWVTGLLLCYFAKWQMMRQTWMIVSLLLYLLVFVLIRVVLTRSLMQISESKKLLAKEELSKLRISNWCVALIAVGLLGIISYLMTVRP
jgi:Predicted integral membrane protein (DUF2269)